MMYGQKKRTFFAVIIYYKASLHEVFRLFNSLQSEPLITNVFVLPQAKRWVLSYFNLKFLVKFNL
jgi:hypothetical protein